MSSTPTGSTLPTPNSPTRDSIMELPELVDIIILHLPMEDILTIKQVSRKLYCAATHSARITLKMVFPTMPVTSTASTQSSSDTTDGLNDTPTIEFTLGKPDIFGVVPLLPNAIGTTDFFIPAQTVVQINTSPKLCSLHFIASASGELELNYHLHLNRTTLTALPPLSTGQQDTLVFHKQKSMRVNVTNWSVLPQSGGVNVLFPGSWTRFSMEIRPCTIQELTELVEKIGFLFQLSTYDEIQDSLASNCISVFFTPREKHIMVEESRLVVDFDPWWEELADQFYGRLM